MNHLEGHKCVFNIWVTTQFYFMEESLILMNNHNQNKKILLISYILLTLININGLNCQHLICYLIDMEWHQRPLKEKFIFLEVLSEINMQMQM